MGYIFKMAIFIINVIFLNDVKLSQDKILKKVAQCKYIEHDGTYSA